MIRLYKNTLREYAIELNDIVERKLIKPGLKLTEYSAIVESGDMDEVEHIYDREDEPRKWKAYHRSVGRPRA